MRFPFCAPFLVLATACAAPVNGGDFEISAGGSVGPGAGGVVGLSQKIWVTENARTDFEVDYTRQEIDKEDSGDDKKWDQVRGGVRWRFNPDHSFRWTARAGVTWLRARGDPEFLDDPGDYGGIYAGVGFEFDLGSHFVTGPDVLVNAVEGEGSLDGGFVPQAMWRLAWRL